jgi:hypothetical protein
MANNTSTKTDARAMLLFYLHSNFSYEDYWATPIEKNEQMN